MNYADLVDTVSDELLEAVRLILNPEIDPDVRVRNLEILFKNSGDAVYRVIYAMNAYDMDIIYTIGEGMGDAYYGLAKYLSDSVSLGGKNRNDITIDWIRNVVHQAQRDAFSTAKDFGKEPIVVRTERGNCCRWCRDHVGTFIDPTSEVFRQHDNCRGRIRTYGYKSRNGLLKGKGWKQQA